MVRHLKSLEAAQRSEYLELAAREANEQDEKMRAGLRARIEGQMARVDMMAGQRVQLMEEMRRIRQQMQAQVGGWGGMGGVGGCYPACLCACQAQVRGAGAAGRGGGAHCCAAPGVGWAGGRYH